ncbi:MAG: hypothetical protein JNK89_03315, partial [Saprospiraceae bacterium]|nr:hypothetical protein [Saprospiraceae bacterium]
MNTTTRLPYTDALSLYRRLQGRGPSCLFESASTVDKSSRMSVIGLEPVLELSGKDARLSVRLLHARGQRYFDFLKQSFSGFLEVEEREHLNFFIPKTPFEGPESERLERQNIAQPLRRLLAEFHSGDKNYAGLYGALSYRFVYLFEDIQHAKSPGPEPDFHLFLFDNVLVFNHLTQDLAWYHPSPKNDL